MSKTAVKVLIQTLTEKKISLGGVIGEIETVDCFKYLWLEKHSLTFKLNIHLGIYEARQIIPPVESAEIILGNEEHKDIIFDFVKGFSVDCFPNREHKDEEIEKLCIRHINNKSLYLLRNNLGEIVSMAANTRGSTNGGTISLVFHLKYTNTGTQEMRMNVKNMKHVRWVAIADQKRWAEEELK